MDNQSLFDNNTPYNDPSMMTAYVGMNNQVQFQGQQYSNNNYNNKFNNKKNKKKNNNNFIKQMNDNIMKENEINFEDLD